MRSNDVSLLDGSAQPLQKRGGQLRTIFNAQQCVMCRLYIPSVFKAEIQMASSSSVNW